MINAMNLVLPLTPMRRRIVEAAGGMVAKEWRRLTPILVQTQTNGARISFHMSEPR